MNEHTKKQCGSPSRDLFKLKHKALHKDLWAIDLDFVLVEKYPHPDIVAAIDFKKDTDDSITFAEVIAYNALLNRGISIYIVTGDADLGVFQIYKYNGGCHKKPSYSVTLIASVNDWVEFEVWEKSLRKFKRSRFTEVS